MWDPDKQQPMDLEPLLFRLWLQRATHKELCPGEVSSLSVQAKASVKLSEPWLHAQFVLTQPSLPRAKDCPCWADGGAHLGLGLIRDLS